MGSQINSNTLIETVKVLLDSPLQGRFWVFELGETLSGSSFFFTLIKRSLQDFKNIQFSKQIFGQTSLIQSTNQEFLWIDNEAPILQVTTKSAAGGIIICKKLLAKEKTHLIKLGFEIVQNKQKKFGFVELLPLASKLLNLRFPIAKTQLLNSTFFNYIFTEIDTGLELISMLPFVSGPNLKLFKTTYHGHFFKESFFKILNTLFSAKKITQKEIANFFGLWQELKDDFPIQFWTTLLMNKSWSVLSTQILEEAQAVRLKRLFSDLYSADFKSKKITHKIFLEPIFHTFLHE